MSCTNPNCECKPGTYANLNPPYVNALMPMPTAPEPTRFETFMLQGLEWQQKVAITTATGKYRVEITWALDRYRVSVYRRVQEPEKLIEVRHPIFARTAIKTANKLLREYNRH